MARALERRASKYGKKTATAFAQIFLLKVGAGLPFQGFVNVGSSMTLAGAQYDVAVAKLTQNAVKQQGQAAVELIQAATAPQPADNGNVGGRLHVVA